LHYDWPKPSQYYDDPETASRSTDVEEDLDDPDSWVFHHPYQSVENPKEIVSVPYQRTHKSLQKKLYSSRSQTTAEEKKENEQKSPTVALEGDPKDSLMASANCLIKQHYDKNKNLDIEAQDLAARIVDAKGRRQPEDALPVATAALMDWRKRVEVETAIVPAPATAEPQRMEVATHTGQPAECAHRVTRLMFHSPAHAAGLIPFFDHLLSYDDIKLGSDTQVFAKYVEENIGKPIKIDVYNTRTQSHRTCHICPSSSWDETQSRGLVGCTLRWVNLKAGHLAARRIHSVKPDSNAARASIRTNVDWVLGVQDAEEIGSMCAIIFCEEDDFEKYMQYLANLHPGSARPVSFMMYNNEDNTIREITCSPPFGLTVAAGKMHPIPTGPALPKLAAVINQTKPTISPNVDSAASNVAMSNPERPVAPQPSQPEKVEPAAKKKESIWKKLCLHKNAGRKSDEHRAEEY
jgi:hypothetical protein